MPIAIASASIAFSLLCRLIIQSEDITEFGIAKSRQRRRVSVAEQHVEDVVALLTAGFGRSRSGQGSALGCRGDAIPVDHPRTLLDAAGNQVLRFG